MPSLSSPSPPESPANTEARAGKGSAVRSRPLRGGSARECSLVREIGERASQPGRMGLSQADPRGEETGESSLLLTPPDIVLPPRLPMRICTDQKHVVSDLQAHLWPRSTEADKANSSHRSQHDCVQLSSTGPETRRKCNSEKVQ